jgi:hypothetical protein
MLLIPVKALKRLIFQAWIKSLFTPEGEPDGEMISARLPFWSIGHLVAA